MGILRDRMIEEMKLRNFSPATQESYVYAVRQTGPISQEITGSATQESYVAGEKFRSFISSIIRSRKIPIIASLNEFDSRRLSLR